MSVFWNKVFRDMSERPSRALLVALAVLIGTATLCAGLSSRVILTREITASFDRSNPPTAVFAVERVTSSLIDVVRSQPEVVAVDSRRIVRGRIKNGVGQWQPLLLFGVPAFAARSVSSFQTSNAGMSLSSGSILVESSSLPILKMAMGTEAHVRLPGGRTGSVHFAGLAQDGGLAPGWQDRVVYAYATPDTLDRLGLGAHLDEVRVILDRQDEAAVPVVERIAAALARAGQAPLRVEMPSRLHPHNDQMQTVLILLLVFAVLGLILSGTLAANMVAAMMTRQIRQIGIMKSIGASSFLISSMYVAGIAIISVPSALLGLVPGLFTAKAFARFSADQLNLIAVDLSIGLPALGAALAVGSLVPLATSLFVSWRTFRIGALQAMQSQTVSSSSERIDVSKDNTALSPLRAYAYRNLTRRPSRLMLTLVALALGGASIMTAANVHRSLVAAVDRVFSFRSDDIDLRLLRPVQAQDLLKRVRDVPGVETAEAWGGLMASIARDKSPNGVTSGRYGIIVPPPSTTLLRFPVAAGRWMGASAGEAVVTGNLMAKEPSLALNGEVTVVYMGRRTTARIVGIVEEATEPSLYLDERSYDALAGRAETAGVIRAVTKGDRRAVVSAIEDSLFESGTIPMIVFDRAELQESTSDHFVILLIVLGAAGTAALIVGGLGLAATVSINVVERSREIGVLRAIGGRDGKILRLFLLESGGLLLAAFTLSFAIALPLSWGVGMVLGKHGLHIAIPYRVSEIGIGIWLLAGLVVGVIATIVPVKGALRESVREVLAYE